VIGETAGKRSINRSCPSVAPSSIAPASEVIRPSADPAVMEMLLPFPDRPASDAWIARMQSHCDQHRFCQWAFEIPGAASLIGAVALNWVPHQTAFTPALEMGWRLA
jgi:RimJ/RimL family protein N-acetyltransferase